MYRLDRLIVLCLCGVPTSAMKKCWDNKFIVMMMMGCENDEVGGEDCDNDELIDMERLILIDEMIDGLTDKIIDTLSTD